MVLAPDGGKDLFILNPDSGAHGDAGEVTLKHDTAGRVCAQSQKAF